MRSATAAALASSHPPDPAALGERERRLWPMLFAHLLGRGRDWSPLPEALKLLRVVGPWREELRQLLPLLAERCDHRLHPLPWALPVPPASTLVWIPTRCAQVRAPRAQAQRRLHDP